ncbi:MAG: carbohydrate-binding protein [Planctomycetota bacterium]
MLKSHPTGSPKFKSHVSHACWQGLEPLEPRMLMSATLATSADDFIDSIGLNAGWLAEGDVHWNDYQTSIDLVDELNIRHGRGRGILGDASDPNANYWGRLNFRQNALSAQTGLKYILNMGRVDKTTGVPRYDLVDQIFENSITFMGNATEGFAGLNEHDNRKSDGEWEDEWRQYQQLIFDRANASEFAYMPMVAGPLTQPQNVDNLGDVSSMVDFGNVHTYNPTQTRLDTLIANSEQTFPGKKIWSTESGYNTIDFSNIGTGRSERAQAKDLSRDIFQLYAAGIDRTYIFDNRNEKGFGLARTDGTRKASFYAIKNIVSLLNEARFNADDGSGYAQWAVPKAQTDSFDLTLSGDTEKVRSMLLQKQDGDFYLVLWQDTNLAPSYAPSADLTSAADGDRFNDAVDVTINFGEAVSQAWAYGDLDERDDAGNFVGAGTNVDQTWNNPGSSIDVAVPDEPLIIQFRPQQRQMQNYYQEAEHYENSSGFAPMTVSINDETASGGEFIEVTNNPPGNSGMPANGYAEYTVSTAESGTVGIWLRARASSVDDGGWIPGNDSFWVDYSGDNQNATAWNSQINSYDWAWYKWGDVAVTAGGEETLKIGYREDGTQLDQLYFSFDGNGPTGTAPDLPDQTEVSVTVNDSRAYQGIVPSASDRIQAEHYDEGGQGVAYNEIGGNRSGNLSFRPQELVDVQGTSDAGGGLNVGWIAAGEWLEYTIDADQAGFYRLDARVSTPFNGKSMRFSINGNDATGPIAIANTGGWQNWTTVSDAGVWLREGENLVRFEALTGDFNFNWFEFNGGPGGSSNLAQTAPVTMTVPASQATLSGGALFQSRSSGYRGDGYINLPRRGGEAAFTVDTPEAGSYQLDFRYTNGSRQPRTIDLWVNDQRFDFTFVQTNHWSSWTESGIVIDLMQGDNSIRLVSTGEDAGHIDELSLLLI